MPLFHTHPLLGSGNTIEDFSQTVNSVWQKLDGHGHSIDDPTRDKFDSSLGAITLMQFLEGDWLPLRGVVGRFKRTYNIINCTKEVYGPYDWE